MAGTEAVATVPLGARVAVAVLLALVIAWVGLAVLRALSSARGEDGGPEDVEELAVFLVCRTCGTEFRVTRVGELEVPRHCGERMELVRRPGG